MRGIVCYKLMIKKCKKCGKTIIAKGNLNHCLDCRKRKCIICGKEFCITHLQVKTKCCSRQCSAKAKSKIKGKNHFNWKGGRFVDKDGYIQIYMPKHPFHNSRNYIKEHRFIIEQIIGRYLTNKEIVHHINGIVTDNRPENLYLFSNRNQHQLHHRLINKNQISKITQSNLNQEKLTPSK